jgi:large subunit ribosomal protein L13
MEKIERKTHVIDAAGQPLGRLASQIAKLLMGKEKSNFSYSIDVGDFVIVKNIDKMKFTGKKFEQKKYYSHSGYLGGLKERTLKEIFQKDPAKILRTAVLGMLPKNKLRKQRINRLKIEK